MLVEGQSKAEYVKQVLRTSPDVYFAGAAPHTHYETLPSSCWAESLDVVVSPIVAEFNPVKLNEFMDGLISGITHSVRERSLYLPGGVLRIGTLSYDEKIGSVKRVTEATLRLDSEAAPDLSDIEKKARIETVHDLMRRTWVRVFPDRTSAQDAFGHIVRASEALEDRSLSTLHSLDKKQLNELRALYGVARPKRFWLF